MPHAVLRYYLSAGGHHAATPSAKRNVDAFNYFIHRFVNFDSLDTIYEHVIYFTDHFSGPGRAVGPVSAVWVCPDSNF